MINKKIIELCVNSLINNLIVNKKADDELINFNAILEYCDGVTLFKISVIEEKKKVQESNER